jgi:hypothetical protein
LAGISSLRDINQPARLNQSKVQIVIDLARWGNDA